MKVTDLMIRDLVTVRNSDTPKEVKAIKQADVINGTQWFEKGTWFVLIDDIWWEIRYINPIPLTEEILKKNFGDADPLGYYWNSTDFYDINMYECSDSIWRIYCHYTDSTKSINHTTEISYVHELQHFFRMCGIEKEIKLQ